QHQCGIASCATAGLPSSAPSCDACIHSGKSKREWANVRFKAWLRDGEHLSADSLVDKPPVAHMRHIRFLLYRDEPASTAPAARTVSTPPMILHRRSPP